MPFSISQKGIVDGVGIPRFPVFRKLRICRGGLSSDAFSERRGGLVRRAERFRRMNDRHLCTIHEL
jgi:hypothetical protein